MADTLATDRLDEEDDAPQAPPAKDPLTESRDEARRWLTELSAAKKWMDKFTKAAERCERAYFDEGPDGLTFEDDEGMGKVNLFWSNVQVTCAAIYGRLPKADVKRKFDDFDDDVSRVAGTIMQRILNADLEREWDDTNAVLRDAVQDRFIVGLGQVWCRYDVEIEPTPVDPNTPPPIDPATGQPIPQEQISNEEAEVDYVHWSDFRYSPCRRWRDCRWVAKRVYMRKKKVMERFKLNPAQIGQVPFNNRTPTGSTGSAVRDDDVLKATPYAQAAIWEIWCKEDNYVVWIAEGCPFVLDKQPDPLQLDEFWPCPQPIVATTLTRSFLPRADYAMAQDLYRELDRVNAKLSNLTQACKAAGVYDKTAGPLKDLLGSGLDNTLLPVDNWSAFVERGGMKGVIDWLPIEAFVNAINQLSQRKASLEHDLYEVLGLSDIMRGASVASETATAQQLKVQYGGARLANLQNEVARFVSEVMRIRANIIANHFQPETLVKRSLIDRTPDAELAQPAIQMLKDYGTSMYAITVTADSLAAPDWAQEKEARTEFLGAASNYIMAAGPVTKDSPMVGSFLIKLLQWAAAGFKGASTIEGVLDQAAKQMEAQAMAPPPPPPPPTPEDQKNLAQADESKALAVKHGAEAERTKKETNLIPPIQFPEPAPPGGALPMGPGGPQPGGPGGPAFDPAAMGAGVPGGPDMPAMPSSPMPTNGLPNAPMPGGPP
jgi:hypothetical protein